MDREVFENCQRSPSGSGICPLLHLVPCQNTTGRSERLKMKATAEAKSSRYPVLWVCQEKMNPDGSLPQRRNLRS